MSRKSSCARFGLALAKGWALVLFAVLATPVVAATAGDTSHFAQALLSRMALAAKTLSYDGSFIYLRGNRVDSMRIIHRADEKGEIERLMSLTGPAREVIRDNDTVTCIFPENRAVMVERARQRQLFPATLVEPVERLVDYYDVGLKGQDRIAGRSTWVVSVQPKDRFRYGYELWIDTDSHLLLKSVLLDADGEELERMMFTQLEFPDHIPDELLQPGIEGHGFVRFDSRSHTQRAIPEDQDRWEVSWLPVGFDLREREVASIAASHVPVEHLVYSDGLSIVSVFVERIERSVDKLEGPSSKGAVHAFGISQSGYQITVVGEVPAETVRQIAGAVVRVKGAAAAQR